MSRSEKSAEVVVDGTCRRRTKRSGGRNPTSLGATSVSDDLQRGAQAGRASCKLEGPAGRQMRSGGEWISEPRDSRRLRTAEPARVNLNTPNRRMRTRMSGGVGGERWVTTAPYPDPARVARVIPRSARAGRLTRGRVERSKWRVALRMSRGAWRWRGRTAEWIHSGEHHRRANEGSSGSVVVESRIR